MAYSRKSPMGPLQPPPFRPDNKASIEILREMPASAGVTEAQLGSVSISQEQAASVAAMQEQLGSVGVTQEQVASVAVTQEQVASTGLMQEQASSVNVTQEQLGSVGVTQEQLGSTGLMQEQGGSAAVIQEQAGSVAVTAEQPSSVAIHEEELRGIPSYSLDNARQEDIPALSFEHFGHANRQSAQGFFVKSAAHMRSGRVQNAATAGVQLALGSDLKTEQVCAAEELTAASFAADYCRLRHLGFTFNDNYQMSGTSGTIANLLPSKLEMIADVSISGDPGSGMDAFFPRSSIIAPVRAYVSTDEAYAFANLLVGPWYVPFVTNAATGCGITVTAEESDCTCRADDGSWNDVTIKATQVIEYGPGWNGSNNAAMKSLPGFFVAASADATTDAMGENYLLNGAEKLLADRVTYHDGWVYTGVGAGAVELLATHVRFTFSLQPIIGYTEIFDGANENANGNGLYMLVLDNIESGEYTGGDFVPDVTNLFVRATEPYNVYFARPRYYPVGLDVDSVLEAALDDEGRSLLAWDASPSLTNYPVCSLSEDVELCLSAGSLACTYDGGAVTGRSWLSIRVGGSSGTVYHPENLPWLYNDDTLPAAASFVTQVTVLIAEPHYVAARVRYGSAEFLIVARRADAFGIGVFLADKGEREQWIVSQYPYTDSRYLGNASPCVGFSQTAGPVRQGLGDSSVHTESATGSYLNKPDGVRTARVSLFAGNRAFLDEVKWGSYAENFSYGQMNTIFLPYAADAAVLGVQDALSYGIQCLCLPLLLPTLVCVPRTCSAPVLHGAPANTGLFEYLCKIYGIGYSKWNHQSGELWLDGTARTFLPSTGTLIAYTTPLIKDGVYATAPALLESYVGTDLMQHGPVLGSRHFTLGQDASFVQCGSRVYQAGKYLLNPKLTSPLTDAEGTVYPGGNQFLLENSDSATLSFFSYTADAGLAQSSSIAGTRISNVVVVGGAMLFCTADGFYMAIDGHPVRVYEWTSGKTWGIGYISALAGGNILVTAIATDATVIYLHLDENLGIATAVSTTDTSSYSKLLRETGTLPRLLFLKGAGASYENKQFAATTAANAGLVSLDLESNFAPVARGGKRFVLAGVQLSYYVGDTNAPFTSLTVYNETSGSAIVTISGSGESASGTYTRLHAVGLIPSYTVKWKLAAINPTLVLYDVRLVGHYTNDVM